MSTRFLPPSRARAMSRETAGGSPLRICLLVAALMAPPAAQAESFHGYRCTHDCSGHEAGYEWAERHGITDPSDCGGRSQSFIEGCEAWAEEHPADEPENEDGWSYDLDCQDEDEDGECDV